MIKLKYTIVLGLLLIMGLTVFAQKDSIVRYEIYDSIIPIRYNCKLYTSLEEALKEPLNVKCLDLSSKGYTEFPMEILQFKNLEFLDLSALDSGCLYSVIQKRELEREQNKKKYPGRRFEYVYMIMGEYSRNEIKEIPKEIKYLSKLKQLCLSDTKLTKRQIKRIKKWVPDCSVFSDFDE